MVFMQRVSSILLLYILDLESVDIHVNINNVTAQSCIGS